MRKILFRCIYLLTLLLLLVSCGTTKSQLFTGTENRSIPEKTDSIADAKNSFLNNTGEKEDQKTFAESFETSSEEPGILDKIISYAMELRGTRYSYGGTSREGFDCSGLVFCSFLQEDILLPRSSSEMAREGEALSLSDVSVGDLLFFITDRRRKSINHVGIITEIVAGNIMFIHATTSQGVVVSSMNEDYWSKHFISARRIL